MFAEANLLSSTEVLAGVFQLASNMMQACTSAQLALSAWLDQLPAAKSAPGAADAASADDSASFDVIDLTADDDETACDTAAHAAPAQPQDSTQQRQVPCKTEPCQQADLRGQLSICRDAAAQQSEVLQQATSTLKKAQSSEGNNARISAASTSSAHHDEDPWSRELMGDLCMLCAYGMDLAAVLTCLLDQDDIWPGRPSLPLLLARQACA